MMNFADLKSACLLLASLLLTLPLHAHEDRMEKPGANVQLEHNYDGQSEVGETENVLFSFEHAADVVSFEVELNPPAGLQIRKGQFNLHHSTLPVSITALENGKHYLGVHLSAVDADGQHLKRVFEIAIQVGKQQARQESQKLHSERKGRKVVILESTETH